MGAALGCMGPSSSLPPRRKVSFLSTATNSRVVAVGQTVYFRVGYDNGSDLYWKWEEVAVVDIRGNTIIIATRNTDTPGADDCVNIDCGTDDLFNLATKDMLSVPDQEEQGGALTEDQREACCSYFDLTRGLKQPVVVPQRHENLPARETEGMLDADMAGGGTGISHNDNTKALLHKNLLCRDKFKSKKTGEHVHKWREAQVVEVQGSNVKIHFSGWSDNHDIWKDLETNDLFDLAPPEGVVDRRQGIAGVALDIAQSAASLKYLLNIVKSTTPALQAAVPIETSERPTGSRRSSEAGRLHHNFVAGQQVEVQEAYRDKDGKFLRSGRWRPAVISKIRGDVLRVHFIGFDSTWDEDIDTGEQGDRVREKGTLSLPNNNNDVDMSIVNVISPCDSVKSMDGMGSAGTPDQRKRKASRRASFDPAQLESYSNNTSKNTTNVSQKFRVLVEPTSQGPIVSRSSFNGSSNNTKTDRAASMDKSRRQESYAAETSEIDGVNNNVATAVADSNGAAATAAAWNAPTKAQTRRTKNKSTHQRTQTFPDPENRMIAIERYFFDAMAHCGYHVIEVEGDGNCLFRAVAHQIWLDESRHDELRQACVRHMERHRSRYEVFCPMNYDEYLHHMSMVGTWADDFEIRALEEMLDRLISIYSSDNKDIRPINKNFDEEYKLGRHVRPIIISYHGGNHYNSVFDERSPLPLGPRNSHVILDMRTGKA